MPRIARRKVGSTPGAITGRGPGRIAIPSASISAAILRPIQAVRPHHRAQCGQGFPHQCGSVGFATHLAFARRGFDGGETLRARLDYADEGGTRQAPPAHPLRYGPPTCYLDFEAMMPPIPLYEGTRPYQTIPFQWSLHVLADDGTLHHREFLADADGDPRHAFAETLIDALSGSDTADHRLFVL